MRRRLELTGLLVSTLWGCGTNGPESLSTVVRDSIGISIVENAGQPDAVWRIVEPHVLEIGVAEGDAAYQLSRVRSVRQLSDGTIVVADSDSREIRFYDSAGVFLYSSGRQGSGPGEYEVLFSIEMFRGDSLLAFDSRLRRVTILNSRGAYVRDWSLPTPSDSGSRFTIVGVTMDGLALAQETLLEGADRSGYKRDRLRYALMPGPSESMTPLAGEFGAGEMYQQVSSSETMFSVMSATLPFARSTHSTITDSNIYVGSSDSYEIRAFGFDGSVRRIIRRVDIPLVTVDDALIERHTQAWIADRGSPPTSASIGEPTLPRVATLPAYGAILGDASGGVWVKAYAVPWEQNGPEHWHVFDRDGFLRASVENSLNLQIHQIGEDFVLGVVVDELGVERVRSYALTRSD